MASLAEENFNSVERIVEYMEPEPEADPDTAPDVLKQMPKDWPTHGAIEIEGLVMRYRPEMPLVLKGVSFSVLAGEKVMMSSEVLFNAEVPGITRGCTQRTRVHDTHTNTHANTCKRTAGAVLGKANAVLGWAMQTACARRNAQALLLVLHLKMSK
jgi:hypothetical protein